MLDGMDVILVLLICCTGVLLMAWGFGAPGTQVLRVGAFIVGIVLVALGAGMLFGR